MVFDTNRIKIKALHALGGFLLWRAAVICASGATAVTQSKELGLSLVRDIFPEVPWSVISVKIDRTRAEFALVTTFARGKIFGLIPLSKQVQSIPPDLGRPLAAINGDFYRTEHESFAGDPRGLQIFNGELVSGPTDHTCFCIDTNGHPQITDVSAKFEVSLPGGETFPFGLNEERPVQGAVLYTSRLGASTMAHGGREMVLEPVLNGPRLPLQAGQKYTVKVKEISDRGNTPLAKETMVLSLGPRLMARLPKIEAGSVLKISTATLPDLAGVKTALGGGPVLVLNARAQRPTTNKSFERHPRSAIGFNKSHIFLVQVDGRQPGLSMGMTLPELAEYLARIGCEQAMNLDGGGSAEVWFEGRVVSSPCYGYERSTANALVLVKKSIPAGP